MLRQRNDTGTGWGQTSVHNISLVQIIDSIEHLTDGLRRILLCELAIFTDSVEQLAAGC